MENPVGGRGRIRLGTISALVDHCINLKWVAQKYCKVERNFKQK